MPAQNNQSPSANQAAAACHSALGKFMPHSHLCKMLLRCKTSAPNPGLAQLLIVGTAAAASTAAMAVAPARVSKASPQLSSFKSLESEVVTHGNLSSGTLSFPAMAQIDLLWRKGFSRHYSELDSAVREMAERAEMAESKVTGQEVSPWKHAKPWMLRGCKTATTRASCLQHLWLHGSECVGTTQSSKKQEAKRSAGLTSLCLPCVAALQHNAHYWYSIVC